MLLWERYVNNKMAAMRFLHLQQYSHRLNLLYVFFTSKLDLNLRMKLIKCYIWSMALYGAETWTLRPADRIYLENLKCGAGEG